MRRSFRRLLSAAMLPALLAGPAWAEMRTWTSASGSTVEAELVRQSAGSVLLNTADGRSLTIRKGSLSEADRRYLDEMPNLAASAPAQGSAQPQAGAMTAYAPKELRELFGKELVNAEKDEVPTAALADKTIGIYFSAHWCGPCRQFTPTLVKVYGELKAAGKPFEVVFVSLDHTKRDMFDYMEEAEMPWLALPFDSREGRKLKETHNVQGIPRLVIVDAKGATLNPDARGQVMLDGVKAYDKWIAAR